MRANIPKQPKPPRAWQNLPSYQQRQISDYALGIAKDQLNKDARIMLDIYIKEVCCLLYDGHGMTEEDLLCFLGSHKRMFHGQVRKVEDNTQLDYLNGRMAEIFKTSGFPQEFFDDMLGAVEVPGEMKGE